MIKISEITVRAENLTKSYGDVQAVKNISFEIGKGELFGFIGPDGAGKTTIFRTIATLLKPDKGTVTVAGKDSVKDYREIREILGYMPGRFSLYQDLSVEENLKFYASIFNADIEENYHLIKDIYSHIEPFKKRIAGKLSGGMKQKLALCCALIHKPEILILDEPTTGVDAVSRKEFWEMLKKLLEYGITIIVSTPYMDEAGLCGRVALIQSGEIMKIDRPDQVISGFHKTLYAVRSDQIYKLISDLENYPGRDSVQLFGQFLHFTQIGKLNLTDLSDYLAKLGHRNIEIVNIAPGIEDCFMELMDENRKAEK